MVLDGLLKYFEFMARFYFCYPGFCSERTQVPRAHYNFPFLPYIKIIHVQKLTQLSSLLLFSVGVNGEWYSGHCSIEYTSGQLGFRCSVRFHGDWHFTQATIPLGSGFPVDLHRNLCS